MADRVVHRLRRVVRSSRRTWRERERFPWELRYVHGAHLASELRRHSILATHRHCTVRFGADPHLGPLFSLDIPHRGTFIVGDNVEFRRGFHCEIGGTGRVRIGNDCAFTSYCLIQCSTVIEIGDGCGIGQSVIILDANHRYKDHRRHWSEQGYDFKDVRIGNGVQILSKATILASVGDGCVIGANSVVTKPIPAYCVAVGAPARVVDYFGPPELRPPGLDG